MSNTATAVANWRPILVVGEGTREGNKNWREPEYPAGAIFKQIYNQYNWIDFG